MSNRKLFKFYRSYYDIAKELPENEKGLFLWALIQKQFDGIEPDLSGLAKFAYISQKHSIDLQVKGWEDRTGEKLTPAQGGGLGSMQGAVLGPSIQEEVKEKEKEKVEEKEEQTYTFSFRKSLVEAGANEILASDWLKVRTRKKAANTETALKGFLKQVEKSGLSINEVLTECIERSWSGFKSEWIEKEKSPAKKEKELTPLDQLRALNKALDNGQITFSDE